MKVEEKPAEFSMNCINCGLLFSKNVADYYALTGRELVCSQCLEKRDDLENSIQKMEKAA